MADQGSATSNVNATASAQAVGGEFRSKPAGQQQQTTGHKPGVMAGETDGVPESSAKVIPAGTAPASKTFQPQTQMEVQTHTETTSAADTLGGATSGDMHTGLGHPGQGMSSNELRHDGGKTHGGGMQGVGGLGASSDGDKGSDRKDFSTPVAGSTQKTGGETHGRDIDMTMHKNPS